MAKTFKATNPHIRREMAAQRSAMTKPMRPYDGTGRNSGEKAIEYARFLARRDGIALPENATPQVIFQQVSLCGYVNGVYQARHVFFDDVRIDIPHVGYDPTRPAIEHQDAPMLIAA